MSRAGRARAAAERWARVWHDAWEALDPEPIVALYAEGCIFSSEPFRTPYRGRDGVREYVEGAFGGEAGPRVWIAQPIVEDLGHRTDESIAEDDRASISWWCALREDGADATLAGTSVLRFDVDGLVAEQWDAWNVLPRRVEPPAGASPFADRDA